jgi:hypothetical protein
MTVPTLKAVKVMIDRIIRWTVRCEYGWTCPVHPGILARTTDCLGDPAGDAGDVGIAVGQQVG